ncbi:MAG: hypothetical protein E6H96_08435 [Chloroflexi bacterium]|nr:MAG: hypothetical protein E6H96_08435 [Chloroflexota bacterium]
MPELARAWPLEIGAALMTAIEAAHGSDELWAAEGRLCPRCHATLEVASRLADAGMDPPPWPSPLLTVFEDELIRRSSPTLTACGRILPYGTAGCDA